MAKVTINGEKFDFDPSRRPMSEALAIENGLKCTYTKWQEDFKAGSAHALAAFICLVWRRDGRDVDLAAILSGDVEIDLDGFDYEPDEGEADPTPPPPEALSMTAGNTSGRSAKSASGPGRSGSSSKTTSKP